MVSETLIFLIRNACAAISMRIQEEILHKKITSKEKQEYIKRILSGENLNLILSWQASDGYFGTRLHTPPSSSKVWPHEGCVRYLLEMGLGLDFTPLKKSQLVAPAGNIMHAFNQDISESTGSWWFFFYELSACLGMMGRNNPFVVHLYALNKYLNENNGLFTEKFIRIKSSAG